MTSDSGFTSPPPGPPPPPGPFSAGPFSAGPPPPFGPGPNRPPWRFARRERGRMLGGVAAGMADAWGIDVTVVRVLWVVATLVSFGLGIAAYAICWIAFPSEEGPAPIARTRGHGYRRDAAFVLAVVLLAVGLIVALRHPLQRFGDVTWAVVLIGGGLAVLLLRHTGDEPDPATPPSRAPIGAPFAAPGAPIWGPPASGSTGPGGSAEPGCSPAHDATEAAPSYDATAPTATAWTQQAPWPVPPTRTRPPRPRAFLTPLTVSLVLIGAGVVTLLDNTGTWHVTLAQGLGAAVLAIGVALVVSSWFGRARGLVPIGILVLLAALIATTIDVPLTGGIGHRVQRPTARADLLAQYRLGIGRLDLDLRSVPLTHHVTRVRAQLGIGELTVDVPSTVRVVVHAHAGAGSVRVFGGNEGGWPAETTRRAPGTRSGVLDLDLRVGAGDVEVRRFEPGNVETLLQEAIR